MTREDGRKFLGRFGVSGAVQTQVMGHLSDGQKSRYYYSYDSDSKIPMLYFHSAATFRVVLAKMANENPHLLLLDEPTNHLGESLCPLNSLYSYVIHYIHEMIPFRIRILKLF